MQGTRKQGGVLWSHALVVLSLMPLVGTLRDRRKITLISERYVVLDT